MEYQEYLTAWLLYLLGCSLLIAIGWRWTRPLANAYPRAAIRLSVSAVLLVPVAHEDNPALLVPATVVALLGAFIGNTLAAVQATKILLLAFAAGLAASLPLVWLGAKWLAKRAGPSTGATPGSAVKAGTAGNASEVTE